MTQKEYQENINKLENTIKDLENKLEIEISKQIKYEQVLQDYYYASKELREQMERNNRNDLIIAQLNKTIQQYEKILERVTIDC